MRPNACGGRGVRTRGAFGYVVTKGLFFLLAFPALRYRFTLEHEGLPVPDVSDE